MLFFRLGTVDYADAHRLQKELLAKRIAGEIGDMTDFAECLDEIVGRFAVVFDDEQTHLGIGFAGGLVSFDHHGAH